MSDPEESRTRAIAEAAKYREEIRVRRLAVKTCEWCDEGGYNDHGYLCRHDEPTERAKLAAERAAMARAAIRPTINLA